MQETIAWLQQEDGTFDIAFANGQIVKEPLINGIIKHTMLCDGRATSQQVSPRNQRRGNKADVLNNSTGYGTLWTQIDQNVNNSTTQLAIKDILQNIMNSPNVLPYVSVSPQSQVIVEGNLLTIINEIFESVNVWQQ